MVAVPEGILGSEGLDGSGFCGCEGSLVTPPEDGLEAMPLAIALLSVFERSTFSKLSDCSNSAKSSAEPRVGNCEVVLPASIKPRLQKLNGFPDKSEGEDGKEGLLCRQWKVNSIQTSRVSTN